MANAYTSVPAIIPGPLTVNGTVTINNDCGIILGGSNPKVRLFKNTQGGLSASSNVGCDSVTRDVTSQAAVEMRLNPTPSQFLLSYANALGSVMLQHLDRTIVQDGTAVNNTGNTTENTLKTALIRGHMIGTNGSLAVDLNLLATVQGATATTVRIKLGGTLIGNWTIASALAATIRLMLIAQNSEASQDSNSFMVSATGGVQAVNFLTAIDTTIDQNLTVTIQNGATTDNWTLQGWRVRSFVGVQNSI
jgi:hypothetical protein